MGLDLGRIACVIALATSLNATASAEAAKVKYTYLKVGEGGGASAYAFKSKQACEAAKRKFDANWASMIRQMKKQTGNRGTFAKAPRTRCLNSLPLGFERPKSDG
jgi:hypothetical protein